MLYSTQPFMVKKKMQERQKYCSGVASGTLYRLFSEVEPQKELIANGEPERIFWRANIYRIATILVGLSKAKALP